MENIASWFTIIGVCIAFISFLIYLYKQYTFTKIQLRLFKINNNNIINELYKYRKETFYKINKLESILKEIGDCKKENKELKDEILNNNFDKNISNHYEKLNDKFYSLIDKKILIKKYNENIFINIENIYNTFDYLLKYKSGNLYNKLIDFDRNKDICSLKSTIEIVLGQIRLTNNVCEDNLKFLITLNYLYCFFNYINLIRC